jgi:hypothetical protein
MSNRIRSFIRDRRHRRDYDQWLPSDEIDGLTKSHVDLDTLLASSHSVAAAAATLDRATTALREVLVAGLFHRGKREPMEKMLEHSDDVLRAELSRVGEWLATATADPFGDDQNLATKVRPVIEWTSEKCVQILAHLDLNSSSQVEAACTEWRTTVSEAGAELRVPDQSVQLIIGILRFVSPFRNDPSASAISFLLARERGPERFDDPAIQDALAAFRMSNYSLEAGDESTATRDLAEAWQLACAFRGRNDVERLAITWLRRHALVGVVWRVLSGVAREKDLAPLMG